MHINMTLIGQSITFLVFVWFCMQYVWPFIRTAMDERTQRIADGLNAAERAGRDLELAQEKATQQLREAKGEAASIIEQANRRAAQIVDEAKEKAREEGERIKEPLPGAGSVRRPLLSLPTGSRRHDTRRRRTWHGASRGPRARPAQRARQSPRLDTVASPAMILPPLDPTGQPQ